MFNENHFIYSDLYEYDFEACVYNILNNLGYDLSNINFHDKEQRNISIGLLQKDNPRLKYVLAKSMKNLIKLYIKENNISEDSIVWKQKDGFIIDKPLVVNNTTMTISFKNHVSKLIKTIDKTKILILYKDDSIAVKGMIQKPLDISFYKLLFNLDFSHRKKLLEGCEVIKNKFLDGTNIKWYVRLSKDGTYTIPMKGDVLLKINESSLWSVDINDVDKQIIFDNYIYPFFQVFLLTFNERKKF